MKPTDPLKDHSIIIDGEIGVRSPSQAQHERSPSSRTVSLSSGEAGKDECRFTPPDSRSPSPSGHEGMMPGVVWQHRRVVRFMQQPSENTSSIQSLDSASTVMTVNSMGQPQPQWRFKKAFAAAQELGGGGPAIVALMRAQESDDQQMARRRNSRFHEGNHDDGVVAAGTSDSSLNSFTLDSLQMDTASGTAAAREVLQRVSPGTWFPELHSHVSHPAPNSTDNSSGAFSL